MTLTVGTSSGAKEAADIHVGTASGNKAVTEGWVGTASGNKQFYGATPTPTPAPLSVTASPDTIGWAVVNPGVDYVSNSSASAAASGGTPPYTYAWSTNSGSATADSPGSAATGFHSGDGLAAEATCTVMDALGETAESNPVSLI